MYTHVDDGILGELRWKVGAKGTGDVSKGEVAKLQAAVQPPTSAHEVVANKLLADVGFSSREEAGQLGKELEKGIDAMVGLIVEAGSNQLDKDDKMHVLRGLVGEGLPKMVGIEVNAVGGVERCLGAMVDALGLGLECQAISCPKCR